MSTTVRLFKSFPLSGEGGTLEGGPLEGDKKGPSEKIIKMIEKMKSRKIKLKTNISLRRFSSVEYSVVQKRSSLESLFSTQLRYHTVHLHPTELLITFEDVFEKLKKKIFLKDIISIEKDEELSAFFEKQDKEDVTTYRLYYHTVYPRLSFLLIPKKKESLMIKTFIYLEKKSKQRFQQDYMETLLLRRWIQADEKYNGLINYSDFKLMCQKICVDYSLAKKDFNDKSISNDGCINQSTFYDIFKKHMKINISDIKSLSKYTDPDSGMVTAKLFQQFLKDEQQEVATLEECELFISQFNRFAIHCADGKSENDTCLSPYTFIRLLFSSYYNGILDTNIISAKHDMNHPLNHYFIASSHNTYLSGHQLHGESSTEMYRLIMDMGARCIEIDCWDGSSGDPVTYHGYTLTTKILFKDVLHIIKRHAFKKSPYPIIISLEVHCCLEQQQKMAKYLIEILGDSLVKGPNELSEFNSSKNKNQFPSPHDLRGKFLLKGYRTDHEDEEFIGISSSEQIDEMIANKQTPKTRKRTILVAKELSSLISLEIVSHEPYPSQKSSSYLPYFHVHNYSEDKLTSLAGDKNRRAMILSFNKKNLTRVYPRGTRFGSSNFCPFSSWITGCQLVSLNYQTMSKEMRSYQIKFEENLNYGYLLKPNYMRDADSCYQGLPGKTESVYMLDLHIICAENIPKHHVQDTYLLNPYLIVQLIGEGKTEERISQNASFDGYGFHFNVQYKFIVTCPEISMLRIRIYHSNLISSSKFLAENCLPCHALRQGFRAVPLRNKKNIHLDGSTLLCYVRYQQMETEDC